MAIKVSELKPNDPTTIGDTEVVKNPDGTIEICEVAVNRVRYQPENLEAALGEIKRNMSSAEKMRALLIAGQELLKNPKPKND